MRARLNDTATDKHALKVRVHQRMQRMSGEEKRIAAVLEGLSSQEEQLRRELDTVTSLMQQRAREGGHRSRKAVHTQPSPSPSPRTPSTANNSLNALREQKHLVCSSIEQLIHKRNTHRQQLAVLHSSITCMTQALYQTHIALRERYTQFGERDDDEHSTLLPTRGGGEIDTLVIQETPRKPITAEVEASPGSRISLRRNPRSLTASVITSPQAPSSPRNGQQQQSGVRFVSNVDEWVLSSVGRLRELRETEGRLEKRLTKLIASRGQLASYFDRIQQFTRRQQHHPVTRSTPDDKPTPPDADTSALASFVRGWSLRTLVTSQEADDEKLRQEMEHVTALVYEHRNRKVLHRILQHVDHTHLPTTRRIKGQLHSHCIRGDELVLWFSRSNLLPSKVDALELIDMMLRGGLLMNVGRMRRKRTTWTRRRTNGANGIRPIALPLPSSATACSLSPLRTPPHWTTSPSPAGSPNRIDIARTRATSCGTLTCDDWRTMRAVETQSLFGFTGWTRERWCGRWMGRRRQNC